MESTPRECRCRTSHRSDKRVLHAVAFALIEDHPESARFAKGMSAAALFTFVAPRCERT
jgi:hypothetical protein